MDQVYVVTEGTPFSQSPGFIIGTAVVDNITSSWLRVPQAGRFVAPMTYGATLPFQAASPIAAVVWQTPDGINIPTQGTGKATVTFVDGVYPYNPGVTVVQATPSGAGTPAQTHVIVDSGSITPVQPVAVTISGQPIAITKATTLSQVTQFANSVAANSSATIVAGSAGKVITVQGGFMGFSLSTDGATAGTLQTSGGAVLVRARADTIVRTAVGVEYIPPVIYPLSDLAGVPIAAGQGLVVTNDAGSAGSAYFSGYLLYTQV